MSPSSDPLARSLRETLADLAEGQTSSRQLVEACLTRIEQVQPVLNAFREVHAAEALAAADKCDRERASGTASGRLHGVPIAMKDMFHGDGESAGCGSVLRAGRVPPLTSTVRQRIDAAGAVVLGTTNMTEFAYGPTGQNAITGDVRNPWNPECISGGSSSGSAAAVAARASFAALGSDTAGSVRTPAALCGLTGLKPTHGRVSRAGAMPLSFSLDTIGPLTRDVADSALLLSILAGPDRRDPATLTAPGAFEDPFAEGTAPGRSDAPLAGLRIGRPLGYFDEDVPAHEAALLDQTAELLASLGATILSVPMPEQLPLWNSAGNILVWGEAFALHAADMAEGSALSPQTRGRLEMSLALGARDYLDAQRGRGNAVRDFCARVFSRCEVLLCPTVPGPTPLLSEVDVSGGSAMMKILDGLTRLTRPANYLGLPALSLPIGMSRSGTPFSGQLIAPPWCEARLCRVGAAFQGASSWHRMAPPLGQAVAAHPNPKKGTP